MTTASVAPAPAHGKNEIAAKTEGATKRDNRRSKRSSPQAENYPKTSNGTEHYNKFGSQTPQKEETEPHSTALFPPMARSSEEMKNEKGYDDQGVTVSDAAVSKSESVAVVPPDDDSVGDEQSNDLYIPLKDEGSADGHYDDPYIYSDDSESLSDAYFHPQQELRPGSQTYSYHRQQHLHHQIVTPPAENISIGDGLFPAPRIYPSYFHGRSYDDNDTLTPIGKAGQNADFSALPSYGSVSRSSEMGQSDLPMFKQSLVTPESCASPLTPPPNSTFSGGTILEDFPSEDTQDEFYLNFRSMKQEQHPPHQQMSHSRSSVNKYQRKRHKRRLRRQRQLADHAAASELHHKQQQQYARELAVTQVRGKPQNPQTCNDCLFAVLFVIQFLFVVLCAVRYGNDLLGPSLFSSGNATNLNGMSWQFYGDMTSINLGPSDATTSGTMTANASLGNTTKTNGGSSLPNSLVNSTSNPLNYDGDERSKFLVDDDDIVINVDKFPVSHNGNPKKAESVNSTLTATSQIQEPILASFSIDYQNVIKLLCVSGIYACMISYLTFGFMLIVARSLIQIILVFSVVLALVWGLLGLTFSDPGGFISVMGFSALVLALWYALYSWHRIPFASTNLYIALCAMRCTTDIVLLGTSALAFSFLWSLVWSIALIGVVNTGNSDDCLQADHCETHIMTNRWNVPTYGLFLLSFYWTNMVIKNIARVTVASAIGTWWFTPKEIGPCCTQAVRRPLVRSLTASFGSICLGSIATLPAQMAYVLLQICCWFCGVSEYREMWAGTPRGRFQNGKDEINPSCVPTDQSSFGTRIHHPTILERMARSLRCYNRWSYTYIGMYGYTFSEGGDKAIQLFETREWMEVVRDNLIQNILLIASVAIGGSAGTFAVIVEEVDGFTFTTLHKPILTSCLLGSVLGFVLSNVLLLGVVGSAVNTVLVCFAAHPFEFDKSHPRHSREMRESWSQQVWEPSAESTSISV